MLTVEKLKIFFQNQARALPLILLAVAAGCDSGGRAAPAPERYRVRVGETGVTATTFQEVFEISKTAYVHDDITRTEVLQQARRAFLNQMVERLTLLERARELELRVSESELDQAVAAARSGYPEGAFERMLLESAIAFDTWKEELRVRLLMERAVEADLAARISVSAEEVRTFLETPGAPEDPAKAERALRRQKVEAAYGPWLEALQERYTVEINLPEAEPAAGPTPRESTP